MRRILIGLVAAFALVATSCGADPGADGETLASGIGVHGAWTIDVINLDGTLDERLEFSNDLLFSGAQTLALVVAGNELDPNDPAYQVEIRSWRILLAQYDPLLALFGTSPCDGFFNTGKRGCVAAADVSITGANSDVVTLAGTLEATQDGFISWAETGTQRQTNSTGGGTGTFRSFTGTSVPEIAVDAGQVIQVQVDISFGTLP